MTNSRFSKVFFTALLGSFILGTSTLQAQVSVATLGSTYTNNFDALASTGTGITWTDNSTIAGWYSNLTAYSTGTGSSTTGALYSFGSTSASDRCIGSLASGGTGTIYYGVRFVNNTGSNISTFNISYYGEQWRANNTTAQVLDFQYQVGATSLTTGTWTDYNSLDFTSPTNSTAGALDGNNASNRTSISAALTLTLTNGQEVWFRWKDSDDTGSDQGFGVDDLSITFLGNGNYYRSYQTGDWNNLSTWESSADNITWAAAVALPDNNANTVTVRIPHTVTVTASVTIDEVTINTGATLTYGNTGGSVLTINDGTGTDLIINGTFEDIGPSGLVWLSSASWSIGGSGTLLRTRGTSSANWRDKYQGGISIIPATANWIVRKTGTDNPAITTVGGMYYPNLKLENTSGLAWATTTTLFTGGSDYPRIKGNLDVGGTGSDAVTFLNACTHATPIPIAGNFTIRTGSSLSIASATASATGFELSGDLLIHGTITYGSNGGSRKLKFSGTNNQNISGVGTANIYALEINKTSNSLTLARAITVDNLLNLSLGKLITTSTNILTLASGSSVSGVSNSSFVSGPMSKTGTTDFIFPVGKSPHYRSIAITSLSANDTYTAEYFRANPDDILNAAPCPCDTSNHDVSLARISGCEYWTLTNSGGTTANVVLSWDAPSACAGVTNMLTLAVAGWDGTTWADRGNNNGALTGGVSPASGTVTTSGAVSTFSAFTLATTVLNDNPLPINLISFNASLNGQHVDLEWSTGSESNNKYFAIERSADGEHFESIQEVLGAGNSESTRRYKTKDRNPLYGISYYRLVQVDFNGRRNLGPMQVIHLDKSQTPGLDYLIVNQETKSLQLGINTNELSSFYISMIDVLGKTLFIENVHGNGEVKFSRDLSAFKSGVYILKISDGRQDSFHKFYY